MEGFVQEVLFLVIKLFQAFYHSKNFFPFKNHFEKCFCKLQNIDSTKFVKADAFLYEDIAFMFEKILKVIANEMFFVPSRNLYVSLHLYVTIFQALRARTKLFRIASFFRLASSFSFLNRLS